MIQRIKQVLLTQYIGAIIVGFLTVQGVATLVNIPVQFLGNVVMNRQRGPLYRGIPYSWESVVPLLVSATLHFLIAYLLLWWLFLRTAKPSSVEESELEPQTDGGNGAA